ncbi:Fc.00g026640.m01.CDS01 [Cosmosporella sp. VM-42]
MASALRLKAGTGLLSRSCSRIQLIRSSLPALKHRSLIYQRDPTEPQRRLFSSSRALNGEFIVKVPQMAESISEGTLASFMKQVGELVEADEELASIETDKIDVAVNVPEAGVVRELFAAEGDVVVVGQDLARIETGAEATAEVPKRDDAPAPREEPKKPEPAKLKDEQPGDKTPAPASPSPVPPKPASQPPPSQSAPASNGGPSRTERVEKMTRMRKTIASRLKQSQSTCASLTTIQEVDMTNLIAWRAKYRDEVAEEHGVRLGYMGAFTKATTLAAQRVPQINAAIDTEKEIITYRDYVDVSLAVSAPKGLVTPVLRNTHQLSIVELERGVATLAKKARDGKLTMDDLEGGSFSISNPGIFGSMFGTPLINYPQAAVFNMNGIQQRAMAINGQAEIRPMMYVSLTYDHRLIDGREAVTFLNLVKKYIEDPSRMLLV